MSDFHEADGHPEWLDQMVADGMVNIVDNVMVTVLPYTAEHLCVNGELGETTRGEDFAIVFETVTNDAEEVHRIIFAIPPEGGAALAAMILRRLPPQIVMEVVTTVANNPGPSILPERNAVPMSEEGMEWNAKRNEQRRESNG